MPILRRVCGFLFLVFGLLPSFGASAAGYGVSDPIDACGIKNAGWAAAGSRE